MTLTRTKVRGEEQETRARILAAAAAWFADQGYAATSIRDIAREVGVTVGAIYVHFASKDRLLAAVYEEGVRRIGEAVDAAIQSSNEPWGRLEAASAAHLKALLDNTSFAGVVVRVIPGDVPEVARDLELLRDGYEARFRALIDALDLAPGCDRTLLRLQLLGALNATLTWYRRGSGHSTPRQVAQHFVAALRDGAADKRRKT
jgi:TetR/AcrR family transcriptional regulator, cholesterol catabolism regulator